MHAYLRESGDFEEWINEQMQTAQSEEYGQDYEHLCILRNKFDEFKRQVESNQERFNRCERMAKWLVEDKGPYTTQVLERQEQLTEAWNQLLEQIEARDQKLFGAGEIHRFNRDVEDALTRIQVDLRNGLKSFKMCFVIVQILLQEYFLYICHLRSVFCALKLFPFFGY